MMIIRKQQIAALEKSVQQRFAERLARLFRRLYPDRLRSFSNALLEETIGAGLRRARDYGLTDEHDVVLFVMLVVVVGWHFDAYPPFHHILYAPSLGLSSEARLDLLTTVARTAHWRASSGISVMHSRH